MTTTRPDTYFTSNMDVALVDSMGDDHSIVHAARVSTMGSRADDIGDLDLERFILFLVRNRHGSPFEHVSFTFRISAPIFVWREFLRHRMLSANEESGRYKVLEPRFYVPDDTRNLVQVGKTGAYEFVPGSPAQTEATQASLTHVSCTAYSAYRDLLDLGVAKEVARMALPLNIYSTAYVTMNLRALTNFLSLRVQDSNSTFPSFPQREIEDVAIQMEALASRVAPIALELFDANGRVPL